jgi:acyl carrier protein
MDEDIDGFLAKLEDIIETIPGSLTLEQKLANLGEWDSLSVLRFLAMAEDEYGVRVSPPLLQDCRTVGDLMKLLQDRNGVASS